MKGNPITKIHKYRDRIVLMSKNLCNITFHNLKILEELDDKLILPTEREFLLKLWILKNRKGQDN